MPHDQDSRIPGVARTVHSLPWSRLGQATQEDTMDDILEALIAYLEAKRELDACCVRLAGDYDSWHICQPLDDALQKATQTLTDVFNRYIDARALAVVRDMVHTDYDL